MKVLSFSYCFPNRAQPTWGMFVFQRLAALARRPGVELEVAAPVSVFPIVTRLTMSPLPATEVLEILTVHRPRYFYFPKIMKSLDGRLYGHGLRKWLDARCQESRPDVLDAHFVWPDGVGVSRLANRLGVPYTVTLRGWLYEAMKYPRILRQCVAALHGAAAIISVSRHLAKTAIELGILAEKVHVIPNGVDTQRFCPGDKIIARRQLGLPQDGRLLLTVAHLGFRKGHRETIRALAKLPKDVRLVLVGGDTSGGSHERELRRLATELGVNDHVIFAGRQPYQNVPLYYSAADISVLASYREGCPNVVLESLASGTPVVASDVGSVPDMIDNGVNGKIVPPQQVEPLRAAVVDLLGKLPSPQEVSRSPAVRSWDDVAADVAGVFAEVARLSSAQKKNSVSFVQPVPNVAGS